MAGSENRQGYRLGVVVMAVSILMLPSNGSVRAQDRIGTTAAPFLTIGTGARGNALGHAYTAKATGAEALFWNPAGSVRTNDQRNRGSVLFSNMQYLVDVEYNAFGLTVPITSSGVMGFSVAYMSYGRMDVTTVQLPEGTGETFGAGDLVVGLSYAQPLTNTFYIGGTAKYIRQAIYDMSAATAAFDIGFVLETGYLNGARIGASIMNFGGQMQMKGVNTRIFTDIDETNSGSNDALPATLETLKWELPLSFKFGVIWPVVNNQSMRLELLTDAHQTNDNGLNADLGADLTLMFGSLNFELRAGYKDLPLSNTYSHFTYGGGLNLRFTGIRFGADFGFVPFEDLGDVTILDLHLSY